MTQKELFIEFHKATGKGLSSMKHYIKESKSHDLETLINWGNTHTRNTPHKTYRVSDKCYGSKKDSSKVKLNNRQIPSNMVQKNSIEKKILKFSGEEYDYKDSVGIRWVLPETVEKWVNRYKEFKNKEHEKRSHSAKDAATDNQHIDGYLSSIEVKKLIGDDTLDMKYFYIANNIPTVIIKNRKFISDKYATKIIDIYNNYKFNSHTISSGERQIQDWCSTLNLPVILNDRNIIKPLEIDIFFPNQKVAVEFDGLYYHSDEFKDKNYHLQKTELCEAKGVRLIHIFEDEWINKQYIVKSIICSALGIYKQKYMARKLTVKELTNIEYTEFMDTNHIQGAGLASIRLGLWDGDDVIQCIGISKSRFDKNHKYELVRMATKLNCQVVGGFSKLLKDSGIKNMVSYIDKRLFNGSGYKASSFKYLHTNPPQYYYTKGETRINRLCMTKSNMNKKLPIFDKNKTEWENAAINGYKRIYDCGTFAVEYN